jgi:molecular chaperone GrpE
MNLGTEGLSKGMEENQDESFVKRPEQGDHSHPHAKQEHASHKDKKHEARSGKDSDRPREKESLRGRIRLLEEENRELKDRWIRTAAEMENLRKRTEKDRTQWMQSANAELLKMILPIGDDLERSLKSSAESDPAAFRSGVEMIAQKLNALLKSRGVTPMEAQGLPFDVDQHDALLHAEREGVPPGFVLEEYEKGYRLNGQVLRHAKVVVSK